jgi:hypothetical protein
MTDDRAVRAFEDVVAIERMAPGMMKIVTWSDAYVVDSRDAGCNCEDKQYNLPDEGARCKHDWGALLADVDALPSPGIVTDNLDTRAVADGGERPGDCECDTKLTIPCAACGIAGFDQPADN